MPLGRLGWLLVLAPGSAYLVWLSGPPRVFHCLPRIRSQAQGPVSSPPSWALVAQTCPLPGGPPPGSCSGTRDCKKEEKNKTEKTRYYFPHAAPPLSLSLSCFVLSVFESSFGFYIQIVRLLLSVQTGTLFTSSWKEKGQKNFWALSDSQYQFDMQSQGTRWKIED